MFDALLDSVASRSCNSSHLMLRTCYVIMLLSTCAPRWACVKAEHGLIHRRSVLLKLTKRCWYPAFQACLISSHHPTLFRALTCRSLSNKCPSVLSGVLLYKVYSPTCCLVDPEQGMTVGVIVIVKSFSFVEHVQIDPTDHP